LPMSPPLPKFVTTARQMASAALTGAAAPEARDDERVDGSVPSVGVLPLKSPVPGASSSDHDSAARCRRAHLGTAWPDATVGQGRRGLTGQDSVAMARAHAL
jgi:hypothetical protein